MSAIRNTSGRFVVAAIVLGLIFPALAQSLDLNFRKLPLNINNIYKIHIDNPVHWIVDLAPFVLPVIVYFISKMVSRKEQQAQKELKTEYDKLKKVVLFVKELSVGNLNVVYDSSQKDEMSNALLKLRDHLKKSETENKIRLWANEGLAKFAHLLRSDQSGTKTMMNKAITELANYVGANQGAIFVAQNDEYLLLEGSYAHTQNNSESIKIEKGEGLIGQCWVDGDVMHLKELPVNYIHIHSGLGEAPPSNVLIVPLKNDLRTIGVIELASFKLFEPFEIDFVIKIADTITSLISSVQTAEQNEQLLIETQQMAAQLRDQEEAMRQNMEHLLAIQEDAERKIEEYEKKLLIIN